MNPNNAKPWPWSPAVISFVEERDGAGNLIGSYHQAVLGAARFVAATHAQCERWALEELGRAPRQEMAA